MVEPEDDDVRVAAVDAWMPQEILDGPQAVLLSRRLDVAEKTRLLRFAIRAVVDLSVGREALAAPCLELRLAAPDRRKGINRLHHTAPRARSHDCERAVSSTS